MSKCNSCDAEIIWARTATGKIMPLDAEPHVDGTIAIIAGQACFSVPQECGDPPRHKSHFATCPNAKQHRKPR